MDIKINKKINKSESVSLRLTKELKDELYQVKNTYNVSISDILRIGIEVLKEHHKEIIE